MKIQMILKARRLRRMVLKFVNEERNTMQSIKAQRPRLHHPICRGPPVGGMAVPQTPSIPASKEASLLWEAF